jgi:hypothetical protein
MYAHPIGAHDVSRAANATQRPLSGPIPTSTLGAELTLADSEAIRKSRGAKDDTDLALNGA